MQDVDRLFSIPDTEGAVSDGDEDLCNSDELSSLFPVPYHLEKEVSLSMKRTYILYMDITHDVDKKMVAGISDYTSVVYDYETLTQIARLHSHKKKISGVKCHKTNGNLVYTSSLDGTIKLWDLRLPVSVCAEFSAEDNCYVKALSSFDVNLNDTYMAAGTELTHAEAYLLFWDVRSSKLLGGYWESNRDDVTSVCFHSTKRDFLVSGSNDGLVNVFDISKTSEEDAYIYCLNTETSVVNAKWFSDPRGNDCVSCTTTTEDFMLWKVEDASPYCNYNREGLTKVMQRKCQDYCYVSDVHQTNIDGEVFIVCGSSSGKGECLRLLKTKGNTLNPMSQLEGNKQIVRTSCYDGKDDVIITGGESGIISMWKQRLDLQSNSSDLKAKCSFGKFHGGTNKPY